MMWTQSDIHLVQVMVTLVAVAALNAHVSHSLAVASAEGHELQSLAIEKLAIQKKPAPSRVNSQAQVIVKDLLGPQDASDSAGQESKPKSPIGQSAVINGNQATYVEPPANFKPIIYGQDNINRHQENSILSSDSQEASNLIGQEHAPTAGASEKPSSWSGQEESLLDKISDRPLGANVDLQTGGQTLKAPVERWLDWHDMSVEPDLASSDSAESASFFYSIPPAPFRMRSREEAEAGTYGLGFGSGSFGSDLDLSESESSLTLTAPEATLARPQLKSAGHQRVTRTSSSQDVKGSVSSERIDQLSVGWRQELANQPEAHELEWPSKESAGGQKQVNANANANTHTDTKTNANTKTITKSKTNAKPKGQSLKGSAPPDKPAANSVKSPGKLMRIESRNRNRQSQRQQLQPKSENPTTKTNGLELVSELHRQEPLRLAATHRATKRRRKSKSNAEVRIKQLTPTKTIQWQQVNQLPVDSPVAQTRTRLIGKEVNSVASNWTPLTLTQQMIRQPEARLFADSRIKSLNEQQVQLPSQVGIGERVPARLEAGKPRLFVRRLGTTAHNSPAALNSTSATGAAKKSLRRRKIKTQLPVGLSSWILGGIRDLDGRHWQLPSDVISKLAVNDVDLAHPGAEPAPKVESPPPGSVVQVGSFQSNDQRQVESIDLPPVSGQTRAPKTPISQLIPR